jgi:hypothetical protein
MFYLVFFHKTSQNNSYIQNPGFPAGFTGTTGVSYTINKYSAGTYLPWLLTSPCFSRNAHWFLKLPPHTLSGFNLTTSILDTTRPGRRGTMIEYVYIESKL